MKPLKAKNSPGYIIMLHDLDLVLHRNVFHRIFPLCYQSFYQCIRVLQWQQKHSRFILTVTACASEIFNFILREISALSKTFSNRNIFTCYLIPKMLRTNILKLPRT